MATKNNPGSFDCYANAKPDEPMFILLGRDPVAGVLVALWVQLRRLIGKVDAEQLKEAQVCAGSMSAYAAMLGKQELIDAAISAVKRVVERF